MSIVAYTDGSCKPNPGPGGWGWAYHYVSIPALVFVNSGGAIDTTNNQMELTALIKFLRSLRKGTKGVREIDIHMDTQYVLKSLVRGGEGILSYDLRGPRYSGYAQGWNFIQGTKRGGQTLPNAKLWRKLHVELKWWTFRKVEFRFHWVKGHSNDPGNDLVDKLAQQAVPNKPL